VEEIIGADITRSTAARDADADACIRYAKHMFPVSRVLSHNCTAPSHCERDPPAAREWHNQPGTSVTQTYSNAKTLDLVRTPSFISSSRGILWSVESFLQQAVCHCACRRAEGADQLHHSSESAADNKFPRCCPRRLCIQSVHSLPRPAPSRRRHENHETLYSTPLHSAPLPTTALMRHRQLAGPVQHLPGPLCFFALTALPPPRITHICTNNENSN
jgi:hypothetical protein